MGNEGNNYTSNSLERRHWLLRLTGPPFSVLCSVFCEIMCKTWVEKFLHKTQLAWNPRVNTTMTPTTHDIFWSQTESASGLPGELVEVEVLALWRKLSPQRTHRKLKWPSFPHLGPWLSVYGTEITVPLSVCCSVSRDRHGGVLSAVCKAVPGPEGLAAAHGGPCRHAQLHLQPLWQALPQPHHAETPPAFTHRYC